ncbi:hypothetical protein [Hydrogenimonas sp.]
MLKKSLLLLSFALAAIAGEYLQLPNGKTVLLKSDGTYEEVTIVRRGGKTIALKPDGTWEEVETLEKAAPPPPPPAPAARAAAPTPKPEAPKPDPMAREIAQKLQGTWKSWDGKFGYIFKGDRVTFIDGRKKVSDTFKIEHYDPKTHTFVLNVGEGEKMGVFSFGGFYRKLRFNDDFTSLEDITSMPIPLTRQ